MKLNDNLKQNPVEHGRVHVPVPGTRYRERADAQDRLLSRIEVAQQFGISKRFLELAGANNDGPPFVRIGRSVRYRAKDVHSWIESCVINPAP